MDAGMAFHRMAMSLILCRMLSEIGRRVQNGSRKDVLQLVGHWQNVVRDTQKLLPTFSSLIASFFCSLAIGKLLKDNSGVFFLTTASFSGKLCDVVFMNSI